MLPNNNHRLTAPTAAGVRLGSNAMNPGGGAPNSDILQASTSGQQEQERLIYESLMSPRATGGSPSTNTASYLTPGVPPRDAALAAATISDASTIGLNSALHQNSQSMTDIISANNRSISLDTLLHLQNRQVQLQLPNAAAVLVNDLGTHPQLIFDGYNYTYFTPNEVDLAAYYQQLNQATAASAILDNASIIAATNANNNASLLNDLYRYQCIQHPSLTASIQSPDRARTMMLSSRVGRTTEGSTMKTGEGPSQAIEIDSSSSETDSDSDSKSGPSKEETNHKVSELSKIVSRLEKRERQDKPRDPSSPQSTNKKLKVMNTTNVNSESLETPNRPSMIYDNSIINKIPLPRATVPSFPIQRSGFYSPSGEFILAGPFIKQAINRNFDFYSNLCSKSINDTIDGIKSKILQHASTNNTTKSDSNTQSITLTSESIEKIAKYIVDEQKNVSNDIALQTCKLAYMEIKNRFVTKPPSSSSILSTANIPPVEHPSIALTNSTPTLTNVSKISTIPIKPPLMSTETPVAINKSHPSIAPLIIAEQVKLESLKKKHTAELNELQIRHELKIKDLEEENEKSKSEYEKQLNNLKLMHAKALNCYMKASCNALRVLKEKRDGVEQTNGINMKNDLDV